MVFRFRKRAAKSDWPGQESAYEMASLGGGRLPDRGAGDGGRLSEDGSA
jgi:hypothetical protein